MWKRVELWSCFVQCSNNGQTWINIPKTNMLPTLNTIRMKMECGEGRDINPTPTPNLTLTRLVWPRSSIEDSFLVYNCIIRLHVIWNCQITTLQEIKWCSHKEAVEDQSLLALDLSLSFNVQQYSIVSTIESVIITLKTGKMKDIWQY